MPVLLSDLGSTHLRVVFLKQYNLHMRLEEDSSFESALIQV